MYSSTSITGTLTVTYKSREITIPYSIDLSPGYGGLPFLDVTDKRGHNHSFVRDREDPEWHPIGKEPAWPKPFIELLYEAFERVYQSLNTINR